MDESLTQGVADLEIDVETIDATVTAAEGTKEQETDSENDLKRDALDLEDVATTPKKESKAEAVAERQAEAYVKKIKSGEITIDQLPANLKWLKPRVEAKLGTKAEVTPPDFEEVAKKVIKEERETARYNDLISDLNDSLSRDKKVLLKERRDHFVSKGLSKLDALETAMEALNIDPAQDRMDARRQAARLRTPGNYRAAQKDFSPESIHDEQGFGEAVKKIAPDQQLAYLENLRRPNARPAKK